MIKKITAISPFIAGDETLLRELLHPENDRVNLPFSLAHAMLLPGKSSLPHRLVKSSEVYFFFSGEGTIYLEEETFSVSAGDTFLVPPDVLQHVRNDGAQNLEFLCIVSPPWQADDEIVVNTEVG